MPYTCGAATTDDFAFTSAVSLGADNGVTFVCGWWYPTTLTATRGYWSAGNTYGAEIDGTTSEIRLRTDNTTDGEWTTTGANITTDKWWFLAFLNATENTGVLSPWKVWVGDVENPPVEVTVTNAVAPVGNFTGSTSVVFGNKGTGSLAFQGVLGWGVTMAAGGPGQLGNNAVATNGVISADEAEINYRRWVLPLWKGEPPLWAFRGPTDGASWSMCHAPMQFGSQVVRHGNDFTQNDSNPTLNGITWSDNYPPRLLPRGWPKQLNAIRR